jgi:hypothetical protein
MSKLNAVTVNHSSNVYGFKNTRVVASSFVDSALRNYWEGLQNLKGAADKEKHSNYDCTPIFRVSPV